MADLLSLVAKNGAANLLQTGAQAGGFDDEDARISRIFGEKEEQRLDSFGNSQQGILRGSLGLRDDTGNILSESFQDRGKDVFFIAKMSIKAPHRASRLGYDHGNCGGVIAVAAEQLCRGFQNCLAPGILAGLGGWGLAVHHFLI